MREYKGRPVGTTGKARAITDEEFEVVVNHAITTRHGERNVAMLVLSFYLGLRAKELAALKISDVYDGRGIVKTLRLIAAYTKGNRHRDICLENKRVVAVLETYIAKRQADEGNLFNMQSALFKTQLGGRFSANSIARKFIDIYEAAGMDNASSHTGRRSLITKLAYKGIDINTIRQIAGHKDISTTQRYIEENPFRVRDVLTSI